jgi:hypothetical protein
MIPCDICKKIIPFDDFYTLHDYIGGNLKHYICGECIRKHITPISKQDRRINGMSRVGGFNIYDNIYEILLRMQRDIDEINKSLEKAHHCISLINEWRYKRAARNFGSIGDDPEND